MTTPTNGFHSLDKGDVKKLDPPIDLGLEQYRPDIDHFVDMSRAANTKIAYQNDWTHFSAWCSARGVTSMPATPDTVAAYLTDLSATHKPSTLERRLSSISIAHQAAGHPSPTRSLLVRSVLGGIRRTLGARPSQKAPVRVETLKVMIRALPDSVAGARDRALLLLGFGGALRRSELVALDVEDIGWRSEGLVLLLRRSKADQDQRGVELALPRGQFIETCPVDALRTWLDVSGITSGAIFRGVDRHGCVRASRLTGWGAADVLKRAAARVGLDPTTIAGHSLRAGYATSAGEAGVPERLIAEQTRHASLQMLRKYIRDGRLFAESPARAFDL